MKIVMQYSTEVDALDFPRYLFREISIYESIINSFFCEIYALRFRNLFGK